MKKAIDEMRAWLEEKKEELMLPVKLSGYPPTKWHIERNEIIDSILAALSGPSVKRPKIVCFCGSSRFIEQFGIFMWEYEKAGNIALGLHWLPPSYFDELNRPAADDHQAEAEGLAEKMDELHLRKIDLADEVFILNVGGYIGESTRNEIEYAKKLGKKIKYLEPQGHAAGEGEKEKT